MDSLKSICEHYLSSILTVESVSRIFLLSDMHQATNLKTQCIDYITDHMNKVKQTDGWKVVTKDRPELGLELLMSLSTKHDHLKCKIWTTE